MHLKGISDNDCWFIFPPLKTPVRRIISLARWMPIQKISQMEIIQKESAR